MYMQAQPLPRKYDGNVSRYLEAIQSLQGEMGQMPDHDKEALLNAIKSLQKSHKLPQGQKMMPSMGGQFNSQPNMRAPLPLKPRMI